MNTQQSTLPDEARSDLRSVVKAVDDEISRLSKVRTGESFGSTDRLKDNWNELVNLLNLGPEPEYRECPFCHAIGMRLAIRCGYCWRVLPTLISPAEAPEAEPECSISL